MKRIALILTCFVAVAALTLQPADAEATLGIGSKAPALDIEHYFDEDDPRVKKFESGNVYVVEFWATWCGPCIASMPHLADLQTKFRDNGVQIVSISDEPVEEVQTTLEREYPGTEKTFAEVTAPYTLTTDPDRSAHKAYMEAAGERGIPTSFIVGKSGLIEWIGHPAELDQPLAAVVDGSWDRQAYKEQREREEQFQEAIQQFAQLAGGGKFEEAGKMLNEQIADAKDEELKQRWMMIRHQFNLMSGQATEDDYAFYREQLADRKGNPQQVYQLAMNFYGITQNGGKVGPLAGEAISALQQELGGVEEQENKVAILEAIARLHTIDNNLDKAIAAQEKAVAMSDSLSRSQKRRMELFLDELKSSAEGDAEAAVKGNE